MCITPINLKKETYTQKLRDSYHMQQVPCGRCIECIKLRVNSWYVRLKNEQKNATSSYFITLTYDTDSIPIDPINGYETLRYSDLQKYFKDIRNSYRIRVKDEKTNRTRWDYSQVPKLRYFAVGEYGSQTNRPHYHIIGFNFKIEDIQRWKYGHVHVGKVEDKSIYYTLKYALKRAGKIHKRDADDTRVIEKALMSQGLGKDLLTPEMIKYYKDDPSRPITMLGDKKLPLPRYYRDKLFTEAEKLERNKLLTPITQDKIYERTADPLWPQKVKKTYADQDKKNKKTD